MSVTQPKIPNQPRQQTDNKIEAQKIPEIVDYYASVTAKRFAFQGGKAKISVPLKAYNPNSPFMSKYTPAEIARGYALFAVQFKNPGAATKQRWLDNSIVLPSGFNSEVYSMTKVGNNIIKKPIENYTELKAIAESALQGNCELFFETVDPQVEQEIKIKKIDSIANDLWGEYTTHGFKIDSDLIFRRYASNPEETNIAVLKLVHRLKQESPNTQMRLEAGGKTHELHTTRELKTYLDSRSTNANQNPRLVIIKPDDQDTSQNSAPNPSPAPQLPTFPQADPAQTVADDNFENQETLIINEFSTGINVDVDKDGRAFSRGFTGVYMNKTEASVPDEVLAIAKNSKATPNPDGSQSFIIADTGSQALVASVSNMKDESLRSFGAYRYFYNNSSDDIVENLLSNAKPFDPLDKKDPNSITDTQKIPPADKLRNKSEIQKYKSLITKSVNEFKQGSPVILEPQNPAIPPIVIYEIARQISIKEKIPLLAAVNVKLVENPDTYLVISASDSQTASLIKYDLQKKKVDKENSTDRYNAIKAKDTVKNMTRATLNPTEITKQNLTNFGTEILPGAMSDPSSMSYLIGQIETFGISKMLNEGVSIKINYEAQNRAILLALLDPCKKEKVKQALTPDYEKVGGFGSFGGRNTISQQSVTSRQYALKFLDSLKNSVSDTVIQARCTELEQYLQSFK